MSKKKKNVYLIRYFIPVFEVFQLVTVNKHNQYYLFIKKI